MVAIAAGETIRAGVINSDSDTYRRRDECDCVLTQFGWSARAWQIRGGSLIHRPIDSGWRARRRCGEPVGMPGCTDGSDRRSEYPLWNTEFGVEAAFSGSLVYR
jgi:hypothetical protein